MGQWNPDLHKSKTAQGEEKKIPILYDLSQTAELNLLSHTVAN